MCAPYNANTKIQKDVGVGWGGGTEKRIAEMKHNEA